MTTYKVGTGVDQMTQGNTTAGTADVVGGGTKLGMGFAGVTSTGPALPLALTGIAASESVNLATDSIKAASEGRPTPIDIAADYYGQTLFGLPSQY
ncbi:MAG: hypothetical protein WD225_10510 [Ilumatobacteraceae bacterium]